MTTKRIIKLFMFFAIVTLMACNSNDVHDPYEATKAGNYFIFNGLKFSVSGNSATLEGFAQSEITSLSIPSFFRIEVKDELQDIAVTSISPKAFKNTSITSVDIPNSVKNIGKEAFEGCQSLQSAKIDGGSIGDRCFYKCQRLTTATFGSSVTHVGDEAFVETALTSVNIPSGSIGNKSFWMCGLESIMLGSGVTSIGDEAFYKTPLRTVDMGNSNVARIGKKAFQECTELRTVQLNPGLKIIDEYAFEFCWKMSLSQIRLPESLERVNAYAFYRCWALGDIIFPNSCKFIGTRAFSDCRNLTSVVFGASLETLSDAALSGSYTEVVVFKGTTPPFVGGYLALSVESYCYSVLSIYVPDGSVNAYRNALPSSYAGKVKPLSQYHGAL